jgi:hypothetical protein
VEPTRFAVRLIMIDRFQKIAHNIQFLYFPSIIIGIGGLATITISLIFLDPQEGQRYFVPGTVSVFWAMSAYSFITIFRSVPKKANETFSFIGKLMRNILRSWYWFIGLAFFGSTVFVVILTYKMIKYG